MTKKGAEHVHIGWYGNWSVRPAQIRAARAAQGRLRSTRRTTPVVHVLVCSKHFCRDFESAGDASFLSLRPAYLRWSHCSFVGMKVANTAPTPFFFQVWSVVFNPMVAGTTLMDPFCDSGSTTKPQHSGHMQPCVTPEVGHGTLAQLKAASSGEIRCWSVGPFVAASRSLKSLVRMTAPSFMHRSRMSSNNAIQTDRHLANSFLMWMDIGHREVGARRVGRPAELASDHGALDGPRRIPEQARDLDRRAREVAQKGILVEENSATVLGDHVEVRRTDPSVTKPAPCTQITCHGPLRCVASMLGSDPLAGPGKELKCPDSPTSCFYSAPPRGSWPT